VSLVLDHLWQSTLLAMAVALLTLLLPRQRAAVRFWLWFAASMKFLLPFALLTLLGRWLSGFFALPASLPFDSVRPVAGMLLLPVRHMAPTLAPPSGGDAWQVVILVVWFAGMLGVTGVRLIRWHRLRHVLRGARAAGPGVYVSDSSMEPGLIGIIRPVVLWPAGLAGHLAPGEVEVILAHEAAHRRRRDNLIAVLHMLVETLFWFWPVVWLVGARMLAEREQACDESVLAEGHDPYLYAGAILKVCRFCTPAPLAPTPLACVSGASAAGLAATGLARRVERIVLAPAPRDMGPARMLVLTAFGALLVAGPLAGGMVPEISPTRISSRVARIIRLESVRLPHTVRRTLHVAVPHRRPAQSAMSGPTTEKEQPPAVPHATPAVSRQPQASSARAAAAQAVPRVSVAAEQPAAHRRLVALPANAPTALVPSGKGDPDAVICRVPRYLPGSRLKGPEVCKTNRIWALLRTQQWEIGPDGVSLISTANTVKPRTLASLAAAYAALGYR
jgi:beta-lactamase regulating signal transducer with metallopeptidase domain